MKARHFLSLSLVFFLISANALADIATDKVMLIKIEIAELVDNYAITRDNLDPLGFPNTFAEDGVLVLRGKTYKGREALRKRIQASDPNIVSMHMMSAGQISVLDENTATGVQYVTVYSATKEASGQANGSLTTAGFAVIGKYHDKYVRTSEGWKFSERRFEQIFSPTPKQRK